MGNKRAAVLGAGSWGTALAKVLADNGYETRIWGRNRELLDAINAQHENPRYLPGIKLPDGVIGSHDMRDVLHGAEVVTLVVPSHAVRSLAVELRTMLPRGVPIVNAMKGIENE